MNLLKSCPDSPKQRDPVFASRYCQVLIGCLGASGESGSRKGFELLRIWMFQSCLLQRDSEDFVYLPFCQAGLYLLSTLWELLAEAAWSLRRFCRNILPRCHRIQASSQISVARSSSSLAWICHQLHFYCSQCPKWRYMCSFLDQQQPRQPAFES